MSEVRTEILERRIFAVERRLHLAVAGWVLSVVVLALVGGAAQKTGAQPSTMPILRAQAVEVVDKTGMGRVLLGITSDGTPGVRIRDAKGNARLELSVDHRGRPGLIFADEAGKARAIFVLLAEEGPTLTLFDATGKVLFRAP